MWKWLGGCLLVCVVLLAVGICTGYRKLSSFGSPSGTETVAIGAPVSRVFASLANADSIPTWMTERLAGNAGGHGMLVPGDSLETNVKSAVRFSVRRGKWIVTEVRPNQLLALQLRGDTTNRLIATRQFSLTAKGDSTLVTSAVAAPMLDSIQASRADSVRASDVIIAGASKLLMAALRTQSHIELDKLKTRLEGHAH